MRHPGLDNIFGLYNINNITAPPFRPYSLVWAMEVVRIFHQGLGARKFSGGLKLQKILLFQVSIAFCHTFYQVLTKKTDVLFFSS